MGVVETRADVVSELFAVVGRFRRQLRRSTGGGFDMAGLTEAQGELLRLVARRPGISIREAADELGLMPNTASTLVSKLAADGLVVRAVDTDDRRVARLRLTHPAQRIADASHAARRAALSGVLEELDDGELDALTGGLRVMAVVTQRLHERTT
ncbi:MarR family winged helix-turn-helix transcriptional regulator [Mycobacterium sp.]|jgi:DNA-binding MarR family transcriptional regulator|uniref:MarR family winged helix-turn-helix transcriptional regulator n=1 Tax=Mycobacterium sp. TaxID=1785 RepID=UPI002D47F0F7|nr:MarR family transcriptional regulator [Mycobacterium sp.]HZA10248.1 MarR family transcriptional regulator [Mycobacterium sp.]